MKIILQWTEGRQTRQTETEIPSDKTWEEVKEFLLQATLKAYKYTDEPLPKGLSESDLQIQG